MVKARCVWEWLSAQRLTSQIQAWRKSPIVLSSRLLRIRWLIPSLSSLRVKDLIYQLKTRSSSSWLGNEPESHACTHVYIDCKWTLIASHISHEFVSQQQLKIIPKTHFSIHFRHWKKVVGRVLAFSVSWSRPCFAMAIKLGQQNAKLWKANVIGGKTGMEWHFALVSSLRMALPETSLIKKGVCMKWNEQKCSFSSHGNPDTCKKKCHVMTCEGFAREQCELWFD